MTSIHTIETALNERLTPARFTDYCPNGLQVEGDRPVKHIVGGVTASLELLERAVEHNADALLVHHGYFWKNEPVPITGMKYRRIQTIMANDMHLLAYHLPLDGHLSLGNNAQLAKTLGWTVEGFVGESLVMRGSLPKPMSPSALAAQIQQGLGRAPTVVESAEGTDSIETLAWCTGGAQSYLPIAIEAGVDAFVSGEISESTTHIARESGIHYFAAGHHATERYGVQAVGQWLAEQFSLQFTYIDCDNPA